MAWKMAEVEDEMEKVWALVGSLSEQLATNRALVQQLKARSDNVKGQAVHYGAGFPLRRFNLDIADEEFTSELEAFASHLVLENQQLQHENKQLTALLKEYEQTLETVMGKFRGVAHASQQHELSLHSYYTSLLDQLQTAHSSAQLHDDTSLSLLLARLSVMLRTALRISAGEDVDLDPSALPSVPGLGLGLDLLSGTSTSHSSGRSDTHASNPSSSPPVSPTRSVASMPASTVRGQFPASTSGTSINGSLNGTTNGTLHRRRAPQRFPGSLPGSSGGYKGTEGQADWAIEREMEISRLEAENASLRELLQVAQESVLPEIAEEAEALTAETPSPELEHVQSRKGSLTVDELQADAEKEEEARRRLSEIESDPDNPLMDEEGEEDEVKSGAPDTNAISSGTGGGNPQPTGPEGHQRSNSQTTARRSHTLKMKPKIIRRPGPPASASASASTAAPPTSNAVSDQASSPLSPTSLPADDMGRPNSQRRSNQLDAIERTSISPRSISPPITEPLQEFFEKVPSGNTGLAEAGASADSAPSHIVTERPGVVGVASPPVEVDVKLDSDAAVTGGAAKEEQSGLPGGAGVDAEELSAAMQTGLKGGNDETGVPAALSGVIDLADAGMPLTSTDGQVGAPDKVESAPNVAEPVKVTEPASSGDGGDGGGGGGRANETEAAGQNATTLNTDAAAVATGTAPTLDVGSGTALGASTTSIGMNKSVVHDPTDGDKATEGQVEPTAVSKDKSESGV